ncbi:hypothetical protein DICPUDRAFT_100176 [Dictyostelium purpureum]|uniref:Uncharacterized protein n=1 Tax=Dictyostelium purpureum TaxID=5786 RepID=F1A694_DICPU|nr:uncharacterized protein DICPUDRAFT_100176 [Dictyostelium purpureum]EGC28285.1 hypothetical protein DICPUDRAFT_100176 [Dictyostelium purpureum]|eukprot:XP_003295188.1 hypothetical protein DICPUDRAFT_100176 [Dictyostelium purpureum]
MNNLNIDIKSNRYNNKNKGIDEIIDILALEFQQKPLECDFFISLFYTSLFHRKNYILCNPFPPSYIDPSKPLNTQKNFDALKIAFSQLPDVHKLSSRDILEKLSPQLIQALYFILKPADGINVSFMDYRKFEKKNGFLKDSPDHLKTSHKPSFVFKIKYKSNPDINSNNGVSPFNNINFNSLNFNNLNEVLNNNVNSFINNSNNSNNSNNNNKIINESHSKKNKKFKELSKEYGTMLGYHGSANENWYNIIKGRGFSHQFVSEECIFGKGFYFSSDSKVSTSFIKWGGANKSPSNEYWWPNSMWSKKKIGFLSACTLINNQSTFRGIEVKATNHKSSPHIYSDQDRSLPPYYILANNSEDIRVKYMLLFSEDTVKPKSNNNSNASSVNSQSSSSSNSIKNNNHTNNNDSTKTQFNNNTDSQTTTTPTNQTKASVNLVLIFIIIVLALALLINSFKTFSNKRNPISHKDIN